MNYEYMISPFEFFVFDEFTKQEAKEYFEWYVNQTDDRIDYLKNYILKEEDDITFDYSPESLIPIWSWYEKKIMLEEKDSEELEKERKETPTDLHEFIKTERLSYETIGICVDIAAYFAETIIKNNPEKLKWGYFTKPKNKMDVNRPVVLGFSNNNHLNPITVVYNCTWHSVELLNNKRLYDMYYTWMRHLK